MLNMVGLPFCYSVNVTRYYSLSSARTANEALRYALAQTRPSDGRTPRVSRRCREAAQAAKGHSHAKWYSS